MRVLMILTSIVSYAVNGAIARAQNKGKDKIDFEAPLTSLVWITSLLSIAVTYKVSYLHARQPGFGAVVEAVHHHLVRHARGRADPRVHQGVHQRELAPRRARSSRPPARAARRSPFSRAWWPAISRCSGRALTLAVLLLVAYIISMHGPGRVHVARSGVRVRPGGVRPARHGTGHDRGRFVRPGDGQRAEHLRAVADRDHAGRGGGNREPVRLQARLRARQALPRGERRRRQHLQGHRQAGADRHRGRRRDHHDLLADRAAHASRWARRST